ncbi:MAG: hypothetical protein K1X74_20680 [Pirellulales bacterium]|nr:hypothetical protein [Pirellulales bacterium]
MSAAEATAAEAAMVSTASAEASGMSTATAETSGMPAAAPVPTTMAAMLRETYSGGGEHAAPNRRNHDRASAQTKDDVGQH